MATLKSGTTGNDTLTSSSLADTLSGGMGNDTYVVSHTNVVIQESYDSGIDTIRSSVLNSGNVYSLLATPYVENLTYTGTLNARLQGNSQSNTINGNTGNDIIEGAAGNDKLYGLNGDDLLSGGTGNDTLDGGANSTSAGDTMVGGAGNDLYLINSSLDQILEGSNEGLDTIQSSVIKSLNVSKYANIEGLTYTGTVAARLDGNLASNQILSNNASGSDTLYGYAGNDTLSGGAGNDAMYGGVGNDSYVVNAGDLVYENAGEGVDTLRGTITSINTTTAGANFATTLENLVYTGSTGATLTGNAMSNLIQGGSGTDTLVGGAGDDRYVITDNLDKVTEGADSIGGANDWIDSSVDLNLSSYANVNNLALQGNAWIGEGSATNNLLIGNGVENYLAGLGGDDVLIGDAYFLNWLPYGYRWTDDIVTDLLDGGAGNDYIIGSLGSSHYYDGNDYQGGDALLGGLGNDIYVISNISDSVSDSGGIDTVISRASSLSIESFVGIENAKLGDPASTIAELSALSSRLNAAGFILPSLDLTLFNGVTIFNLSGNDLANTLTGNSYSNELNGGVGNDTLYGGAGPDVLIGGVGNDSLIGGDGDDVYEIDSGDILVETISGGRDAIRSATITTLSTTYTNIEGLLYVGAAGATLSGNAANNWIGGGSGADTINGVDGNDLLQGGSGNDSVLGGLGDDTIEGGLGANSLYGGGGNDSLYAEVAYLSGGQAASGSRLYGEDGNDSVVGGTGGDTLDGGAGNDTLSGWGSNDALNGGAGNDQIYGGDGNDTLSATGQVKSADPYTTSQDILQGGAGNDIFRFTEAYAATADSFNLMGNFATGHSASDFVSGSDKLSINKLLVGNGDTVLTSATATAGTSTIPPVTTFSNTAELVIFTGDVGFELSYGYSMSAISAASVITAIGSASASFATGDKRLFVLSDGEESAIFQFTSAAADSAVSATELKLIGVVTDASLLASDFVLA